MRTTVMNQITNDPAPRVSDDDVGNLSDDNSIHDEVDASNKVDGGVTSTDDAEIYVTELNDHDVLLGRGTGPNSNGGNIKFRSLVEGLKIPYMTTKSRKAKKGIVKRAVRDVKEKKGRFLNKLNKQQLKNLKNSPRGKTTVYEIAADGVATEKTKQAIRYVCYKRDGPQKAAPPATGSQSTDTASDGRTPAVELDSTSSTLAMSERRDDKIGFEPSVGTIYQDRSTYRLIDSSSAPFRPPMPPPSLFSNPLVPLASPSLLLASLTGHRPSYLNVDPRLRLSLETTSGSLAATQQHFAQRQLNSMSLPLLSSNNLLQQPSGATTLATLPHLPINLRSIFLTPHVGTSTTRLPTSQQTTERSSSMAAASGQRGREENARGCTTQDFLKQQQHQFALLQIAEQYRRSMFLSSSFFGKK